MLLIEDNPALGLADYSPGSDAAATCPFIPFAAMAASMLPWPSSRGAESNSCGGQCQSSFPGLQLVHGPGLEGSRACHLEVSNNFEQGTHIISFHGALQLLYGVEISEVVCPAKPNIFTAWPFAEKVY